MHDPSHTLQSFRQVEFPSCVSFPLAKGAQQAMVLACGARNTTPWRSQPFDGRSHVRYVNAVEPFRPETDARLADMKIIIENGNALGE